MGSTVLDAANRGQGIFLGRAVRRGGGPGGVLSRTGALSVEARGGGMGYFQSIVSTSCGSGVIGAGVGNLTGK